jgi:S-adenosylmethionine synthetase
VSFSANLSTFPTLPKFIDFINSERRRQKPKWQHFLSHDQKSRIHRAEARYKCQSTNSSIMNILLLHTLHSNKVRTHTIKEEQVNHVALPEIPTALI